MGGQRRNDVRSNEEGSGCSSVRGEHRAKRFVPERPGNGGQRRAGRGSEPHEPVGCGRLILLGPPALCLLLAYPVWPMAFHSVIHWRDGLLPLQLAFFGAALGHLAAPGYYALVVMGAPSKRGLLRSWMACSVAAGALAAVLAVPAFLHLAYPLLVLPTLTLACCVVLFREMLRDTAPPDAGDGNGRTGSAR